MKTILLVVLTIISISGYSQSKFEKNVYIPIRTYHFNRENVKYYHPTEGGNLGAVMVFRKFSNNEKWFIDYQFGAIRNSFDKLSIVGQFGFGYKSKLANGSLNIGLISGYEKLYKHADLNMLPYVMEELGVIPLISISIEPNIKLNFNRFELKPLIIITPEFLNGGILIKIKQKLWKK